MRRKPFYLKHYVLLLLCCLHSVGGWGQVNFIKNPSFEQYDSCPDNKRQIFHAHYWTGIDSVYRYDSGLICMPDYLNTCMALGAFSVPHGLGNFFHYPHSGNGMAAEGMYSDTPQNNPRYYLMGRLRKPLSNGHVYCLTFYVALAQCCGFACNRIGAYFDNGSIDTAGNSRCGNPLTEYMPQVYEPSVIRNAQSWNDSTTWTKIEGSLLADGSEKYITIGNFFTNAQTTILTTFNPGYIEAYYLIDDISVIESGTLAHAGNDTTIVRGDSLYIGEEAVPNVWYKDSLGQHILVDSTAGGIWIKPDTTTTYVVKLTLCGVVTWDSIKVTVVPVGINNIKANESILLYPNPTENQLNITNAPSGTNIKVYDVVGRLIYSAVMHSNQESINTSAWERGTYFVELVLPDGSREVRKVVK
jgi:hypothetical protein